ncbi:MAG: hypothetical protein M5U09_14730 [Gammaproteobacteria bacterium]|nr:hypothetical protein [Gammaproteobacteria bacterium]
MITSPLRYRSRGTSGSSSAAEVVLGLEQRVLQDRDVLGAVVVVAGQVDAVDVDVARSEDHQAAAYRLDAAVVLDDRVVHRHADRRTVQDIDPRSRVGYHAAGIDVRLHMRLDVPVGGIDVDRASRGDDVRQVEHHGVEFLDHVHDRHGVAIAVVHLVGLGEAELGERVEYLLALHLVAGHGLVVSGMVDDPGLDLVQLPDQQAADVDVGQDRRGQVRGLDDVELAFRVGLQAVGDVALVYLPQRLPQRGVLEILVGVDLVVVGRADVPKQQLVVRAHHPVAVHDRRRVACELEIHRHLDPA